MFKPGDKVTFVNEYKKEQGLVKSLSDDKHVFVVYHCDDEWDRYFDYTAARTKISDLVPGWIVEDREADE